jgi:quercetin dioxygenase-like cupin family protein
MGEIRRYLVSFSQVKPLAVGEEEGFKGVDSRLLICDETVGDTTSCLFRASFPPKGFHGRHVHDKTDELLYCISGEAIQGIDNEEYVMRPGDAMIIPKGRVHYLRNDGKETFIAIGIYPNAKNFEDTGQHLI